VVPRAAQGGEFCYCNICFSSHRRLGL
jgi:hypothetical protein